MHCAQLSIPWAITIPWVSFYGSFSYHWDSELAFPKEDAVSWLPGNLVTVLCQTGHNSSIAPTVSNSLEMMIPFEITCLLGKRSYSFLQVNQEHVFWDGSISLCGSIGERILPWLPKNTLNYYISSAEHFSSSPFWWSFWLHAECLKLYLLHRIVLLWILWLKPQDCSM